MTTKAAHDSTGLDGVVVADTKLSHVDGERGRLVVAGYDIERLAGKATFEDVCGLLWTGALPSSANERSIRQALGAARATAFARLGALGDALSADDCMDALRAATAHLDIPEADAFGPLPSRIALADVAVVAAVSVFAAAWARIPGGEAPIPPDPALSHAADYLRMVTGSPADDARAAALDAYLVTVADHGMNASTFSARVVASTGSDLVSSVVAAIGALKGPLHGGAPGPVLDMLDAIGHPDRAVGWLEAELAAGRRIMGMGHRIYRVRDPRAAVLEGVLSRLESAGIASGRLTLARAVEDAAGRVLRARYPNRPLHANVEFYTAVVLDAVGLPRELFTGTFAVARVAGWCAHVAEQRATGRLIRPSSRYVGPIAS